MLPKFALNLWPSRPNVGRIGVLDSCIKFVQKFVNEIYAMERKILINEIHEKSLRQRKDSLSEED